MFSLFYNLAKIINYINFFAVIVLMGISIASIFKPEKFKVPNFEDVYDYVKKCFIVSLIFMLAAWLVVSSQDETSILKMYSTISGGFRDMGMLWFINAIIYMIVPLIIALAGYGNQALRQPFNRFRNRSFIMGAICEIISFLLAVS